MTTIALGRSKAPKGLPLSGEPTVQLLPPAVRDRAKNREFRQFMVLLLILALVIVVGGVAFGLFRNIQSQDALTAANAETARLLAEQESYRADAAVADVVEATKQAQQIVTAGEIDYLTIVQEVAAALDDFGDLELVTFGAPAAWQPALGQPGILRATPAVVLSLSIRTKTIVTSAQAVEQFQGLTGYIDSSISESRLDTESGRYLTQVSISLTDEVLLERFPTEEEGAAGDGEASVETEGVAQ